MGPTDSGPSDAVTDRLILKLNIKLLADVNAVDPIVHRVMAIVKLTQCAEGKEDAIEISLAEALANAVVHGAKSDSSKVIECDVVANEGRGVLIIVRDPGAGFDPAKIPSPVQGENIFASHGRGIYLINQLMDEVKFAKNGAEIHMLKR